MNTSLMRLTALLILLLTGCATEPNSTTERSGARPRPPYKAAACGWGASWSPNHKQIVFAQPRGDGLVILDLATAQRTALAPKGKDPVWSPNGRYIAYVKDPEPGTPLGEETWIIRPNGRDARRLAQGGYPRWSKDGRTLYFHSRADNRILAVRVDDPQATPEVFFEKSLSWYPSVSPDGTLIAFGSGGKLQIIERATGKAVLSCDALGARGLLPSWSPDGRYVTFGGFDHSPLGLWCFEVSTGKAVMLAEGPFNLPMWSKDGKRMTFDWRCGNTFEVWVVGRDWVDACLRGRVPPFRREEPQLTGEKPGKVAEPLRTQARYNRPAPADVMLPTIPAAELLDLKAAGDAFMRQFSASECADEYKSAFEGLAVRYAADKREAASRARAVAVSVNLGQVELKEEIGAPIKGEFVFIGSRRIGGRLLKLAYLRKHSLGPLPVVLVFQKRDREWTIAQFAIGAGTAGPDVDALWVHEPPSVLTQTIADFPKIQKSTDECMKSLVQGETRSSIETLVKSYSHNVPTPGLLIESFVRWIEGRPDIMGTSLGYELLGTARQSDSLCKLIYTWRFEERGAPLCFEFYKTADGWLLWRVRMFDAATSDLTATTVSEPAK